MLSILHPAQHWRLRPVFLLLGQCEEKTAAGGGATAALRAPNRRGVAAREANRCGSASPIAAVVLCFRPCAAERSAASPSGNEGASDLAACLSIAPTESCGRRHAGTVPVCMCVCSTTSNRPQRQGGARRRLPSSLLSLAMSPMSPRSLPRVHGRCCVPAVCLLVRIRSASARPFWPAAASGTSERRLACTRTHSHLPSPSGRQLPLFPPAHPCFAWRALSCLRASARPSSLRGALPSPDTHLPTRPGLDDGQLSPPPRRVELLPSCSSCPVRWPDRIAPGRKRHAERKENWKRKRSLTGREEGSAVNLFHPLGDSRPPPPSTTTPGYHSCCTTTTPPPPFPSFLPSFLFYFHSRSIAHHRGRASVLFCFRCCLLPSLRSLSTLALLPSSIPLHQHTDPKKKNQKDLKFFSLSPYNSRGSKLYILIFFAFFFFF